MPNNNGENWITGPANQGKIGRISLGYIPQYPRGSIRIFLDLTDKSVEIGVINHRISQNK